MHIEGYRAIIFNTYCILLSEDIASFVYLYKQRRPYTTSANFKNVQSTKYHGITIIENMDWGQHILMFHPK